MSVFLKKKIVSCVVDFEMIYLNESFGTQKKFLYVLQRIEAVKLTAFTFSKTNQNNLKT